jgi:hypothetical protein
MNSRNTILDAASLIEPASNPKVEHKSRGFLRELNSGGATPLEQLSPKEARDLLAALQASAPHNGASRGDGFELVICENSTAPTIKALARAVFTS